MISHLKFVPQEAHPRHLTSSTSGLPVNAGVCTLNNVDREKQSALRQELSVTRTGAKHCLVAERNIVLGDDENSVEQEESVTLAARGGKFVLGR